MPRRRTETEEIAFCKQVALSLAWAAAAIIGAVVIVIVVVLLSITAHANGATYGVPSLEQYFSGLMQPDQKDTPCCGVSDAYWADQVAECDPSLPGEGSDSDCAFVAIITDPRSDEAPYYTNGKRAHIPIGTRIPVPGSKKRKPPIPNPTDHNIIFTKDGSIGWIVYCWEPSTGG